MKSPSVLLDPATPHRTVLDTVKRCWKRSQFDDYTIALGLRRLFRDNVHRGAGFARFVDYAEFAVDMPTRLAGAFSFLGEHLERLPKVRAEMERGGLTYTKAREFVKVADADSEEFWIDYAKSHTNRALEKRVKRWRAAKEGTPYEEKKEVASELGPRQVQAARKARETLMKETGKPVPERELLGNLLDIFAEGGFSTPPPGKPDEESGNRAEKLRPYLAIHLCPSCTHTWVPVAGENLEVAVSEWIDEMKNGAEVHDFLGSLLCGCKDVRHRRDRCPRWKPPEGEPAKSRTVPAAVQRRIEARDGFRCRRPGCGNALPIEKGHMEKPFRDGAPMTEEHLGHMCDPCNDMIETKALRVEGYAPFEKYHLRDGTCLGFGFDPEIQPEIQDPEGFEQRESHVESDPEEGEEDKRAPPGPDGGAGGPS